MHSVNTLISFQSKKLHNFSALLKTIGVTSLITCQSNSVCRYNKLLMSSRGTFEAEQKI